MAEWHALAKLRMHTEVTLKHLENATVAIGKELRSFRDKSRDAYTCKELPGETSWRARHQRKKKEKEPPSDNAPPLPELPPKTKLLNLCTYKLHALGDYVHTIRMFGTTDSYSTQIVSITSTVLWT